MKIIFSVLLLIFCLAQTSIAQVAIGTNTPSPSAQFEVFSTERGFLPPRLTTAQRDLIATPAIGLLIFQTDNTVGYYYYNGTAWVNLGAMGAAGTNGTNGLNALIKTTTEVAGANCANGGTKIETGLDANANGVLDINEVNIGQTTFICNNSSSNSVSSNGVRIGYGQSGIWTCPAGVNQITIELWGGGGGGQQNCPSPGANGGNGGYNKQVYSVVPGNSYIVIIGNGGSINSFGNGSCGGMSNHVQVGPGGNGENSSFDGAVFAQGGTGGSNGSNGQNGAFINWQYGSAGTAGTVTYIPNSWVQNPPTGVASGGVGSSYCGYSFIGCSAVPGENGYCVISY
jgi:hypothetical protein